MDRKIVEIFKVRIDNLKMGEILEKIEKGLIFETPDTVDRTKKPLTPFVIFTPNSEIIMQCQKNEKLLQIVNSSQINIADGQGVVWASKILGNGLTEKVSGIDLMEKLAEMAGNKGLAIGLIGGGPGIALKALECLKKKYSGLQGAAFGLDPSTALGMTNKYFKNLAWEIKEKNIAMIFVGLGCPKQEYFIEELRGYILRAQREVPTAVLGLRPRTITSLVLMAVGGSFDILSGRLARAPLFLRKTGLEWLWRLVLEPWRWKRQLALVKFVWLVLRQKHGKLYHT